MVKTFFLTSLNFLSPRILENSGDTIFNYFGSSFRPAFYDCEFYHTFVPAFEKKLKKDHVFLTQFSLIRALNIMV